MKQLEIWADSFHEGVWCCEHICYTLECRGYEYKCDYINGFIPHYVLSKQGMDSLEFIVYGAYKSWDPIPKKIKDLIEWGKPDIIAFDAQENEIIFAVEETAATPTGNQAMQRCERQYGSARMRIPYWYFVSEYSEHSDGGIRRDSIWPSIAAIKLSIIEKTPCVVLHYSDIDNVEDYNSGNGLSYLFSSLSQIIANYMSSENKLANMDVLLAQQYEEMISYISTHWSDVIDFLPSENLLQQNNTPAAISRFALSNPSTADLPLKSQILVWPLLSGVPVEVLARQKGKELIKHDDLSKLLENDISNNKCYILSNNTGSGKPQKANKIQEWINQQRQQFNSAPVLNPPAVFNMTLADFPKTNKNNRHVTTAKNIVYLYDSWSDLKKAIETAYPRLLGKLNDIPLNKPVFMYICNSVCPGRLFGDPFTGQLTAFSVCFGKFDVNERSVVAYFPHQSHSQVLNTHSQKNKGMTLYGELADYLIFTAGVVFSPKTMEVV